MLGLSWMKHTPVRLGCVACWESLDEHERDRHLIVRGAFARDGSAPVALSSRLPVSEFPPSRFLDAAREADGGVVILVPLRTASVDWGILAVEGPAAGLLSGGFTEPTIRRLRHGRGADLGT